MSARSSIADARASIADYRALAEIGYQIRRYLHFNEEIARQADLEPQQLQLLVMLMGLPAGQRATISALAERLQIRHHSAVGLIDRLEERGLAKRCRNKADRRQVFVRLTRHGEQILRDFSHYHFAELRSVRQELVRSLNALTDERAEVESSPSRTADAG